MTTLERSFEDDLQAALLDNVEERLAELMENFVEVVHANLRAYAQRHDYDVASTIDSVSDVTVDRRQGTVTVTVGWQSQQMARWEFGTSDHHVDGDPVLSFVWEARHDPPQWVREEFDQARTAGGQFRSGWRVFLPDVNVAGIPESRAIRDGMHALRRVVAA